MTLFFHGKPHCKEFRLRYNLGDLEQDEILWKLLCWCLMYKNASCTSGIFIGQGTIQGRVPSSHLTTPHVTLCIQNRASWEKNLTGPVGSHIQILGEELIEQLWKIIPPRLFAMGKCYFPKTIPGYRLNKEELWKQKKMLTAVMGLAQPSFHRFPVKGITNSSLYGSNLLFPQILLIGPGFPAWPYSTSMFW